MRKYTNYKTFAKFLTGGKFNITSKDFEELPEDLMDKHVLKILNSKHGKKCRFRYR